MMSHLQVGREYSLTLSSLGLTFSSYFLHLINIFSSCKLFFVSILILIFFRLLQVFTNISYKFDAQNGPFTPILYHDYNNS